MLQSSGNKNWFHDPTLFSLIVSNLITIVLAIVFNWGLAVILWSYWLQSIIIGFFNFVRILSLKDFSTEGFRIGNINPKPTIIVKLFTAFFFAFHYGFFHFVYAIFLVIFSGFIDTINIMDFFYILFTGVIFFANHLFSFLYHKSERVGQNIGKIMFAPYARIIPMHLTLMFGMPFSLILGGKLAIIIFLALKTIADAVMHVAEHKKK